MNKQIEELKKDISYELGISYEEEKLPFSLHTRDYLAKVLIEKGYQKVDKDKQVVLSREEYNRLLACEHNLNVGRESYRRMEERAYKTIEELNQELAQERKETAREILSEVKERMFSYFDCVNEKTAKCNYKGETLMNYEVADMIDSIIENLVEKYGVEIKE